MSSIAKRPYLFVLFFIVIFLGLISMMSLSETSAWADSVFSFHLDAPHTVSVHHEASIRVTIRAQRDVSGVRARAHVPPQVQLMGGNFPWFGTLKKGDRIERYLSVQCLSPGNHEIKFYVEGSSGGNRVSDGAYVVLLAAD